MEDIKKLIDGYQIFKKNFFKIDKSLYIDLAKGQEPKILVIGCCDSRVDPAILFNCDPGELFVVRNVGNLIPPHEPDLGKHATSAAIEFAVTGLLVNHAIILGHSQCGGIRALLNRCEKQEDQKESYLQHWMNIAKNVAKQVLKEHGDKDIKIKTKYCEQNSLLNSLNNLNTFPFIKNALKEKKIFLHVWYFNIEDGKIYAYYPNEKAFYELLGDRYLRAIGK